MKKVLSLIFFSLMFCLLTGKSTCVFAAEAMMSMEEVMSFMNSLEEDAKKNITNEMVEDFQKTKSYNNVLLNEAKRISWEKSEKKRIAEKAATDTKYKKLEEILNDIQDMMNNKKDIAPQKALDLVNEGLSIEDMPILHFYKANLLGRTGQYKESSNEIMNINPNDGKMFESYYTSLVRANFGNTTKQLEILSEGINNASSLPIYFELIKTRAMLNKKLGNNKEYLEDRKTLLILKKMEQLGKVKLFRK